MAPRVGEHRHELRALARGTEVRPLRVATTAAEWLELVQAFFGLPLAELLSAAERDALWRVVSAKQREWFDAEAAKRRRRWVAAAVTVAGVAAAVVVARRARGGRSSSSN